MSFTTFNNENEINRQTSKPIYKNLTKNTKNISLILTSNQIAPYDTIIHYNKFLLFYNLPLLPN
jgi:hypothetical protein